MKRRALWLCCAFLFAALPGAGAKEISTLRISSRPFASSPGANAQEAGSPAADGKNMTLYAKLIARSRRLIAEASVCAERPRSQGEIFALAMRDYWQREMQLLWIQDERLNLYYPGAQGRIDVTDKDCGLIRDKDGNPLRIGRDTCHAWKLTEYNTLDKLAERLKLVPQFGASRGFDRPGGREGGWIYDEIVRGLLRGEVQRLDTERLYLPEHADGNTGFAVLFKRGNAVRWYGPDCCRLLTVDDAEKEAGRLERPGHATMICPLGKKGLPRGVMLEDLYYLRVSYRDVDFNLDSGQGGVHAFGKGEIGDHAQYVYDYYAVSPCGELICGLVKMEPCE